MTEERKIVKRILDARMAFLLKRERYDKLVCRLPDTDYDEWSEWIFTIDNDPILGYKRSGLQDHAFGMDIVHAPGLQEITIEVRR